MKLFVIVSLAAALIGTAVQAQSKIDQLADIGPDFRIQPYLEQAVALQNMGRDQAIAALTTWAAQGKHENQVIILCRMLFTAKPGEKFRRPMIGGAHFYGGTSYDDWPLEPIAIFEGIPVLITSGYMLAGCPEPSFDYVFYCRSQCQWNEFCYQELTNAEISSRLEKFIASTKWKIPPAKWDAEMLAWLRQQAR